VGGGQAVGGSGVQMWSGARFWGNVWGTQFVGSVAEAGAGTRRNTLAVKDKAVEPVSTRSVQQAPLHYHTTVWWRNSCIIRPPCSARTHVHQLHYGVAQRLLALVVLSLCKGTPVERENRFTPETPSRGMGGWHKGHLIPRYDFIGFHSGTPLLGCCSSCHSVVCMLVWTPHTCAVILRLSQALSRLLLVLVLRLLTVAGVNRHQQMGCRPWAAHTPAHR